MNTARSTALGWGALIAGAGVSFYFAKKGIEERRQSQANSGIRPPEIKDWKQRIQVEKEGEPYPQRANDRRDHNYTAAGTPEDNYKAAAPPGKK